jgi:glutamate carboxypeptidase
MTAMTSGPALRERADGRLPGMLADLEALVRCESPSSDRPSLVRCADLVAGAAAAQQLPVTRLTDAGGGPALLVGAAAPRVLLLGHLDTVHPLGTLEQAPYRVQDGRVFGPGVLDMKAGLVQAVHALALAGADDAALLVTSDEEVGTPNSRDLITGLAAGAAAVLVLEASLAGALKTERKGVSSYQLQLHGRAAHAGLEPHRGANATLALARAVLAVATLADPEAGTTVTPTLASSGSSANTVPELATLAVDVRAVTLAEQDRVDAGLRGLGELEPGVRTVLAGGPNRPPMPAATSSELFSLARAVATDLGLPAPAGSAVGGGSDGNLTAALGIPTLDGLGAVGEGPHTPEEWADVAEIPARTTLLTALLQDPRTRTADRPRKEETSR